MEYNITSFQLLFLEYESILKLKLIMKKDV